MGGKCCWGLSVQFFFKMSFEGFRLFFWGGCLGRRVQDAGCRCGCIWALGAFGWGFVGLGKRFWPYCGCSKPGLPGRLRLMDSPVSSITQVYTTQVLFV